MKFFINHPFFSAILTFIALFSAVIGWNAFKWNNGVCRMCGGHYEYADSYARISYGKDSTSSHIHYLFSCEDCGHMIDMGFNPRGIIEGV